MELNTKKNRGAIRVSFFLGAFLLILVAAGALLIFSGQENRASLTAGISQVVESINTEDISIEAIVTPEDTSVQPQPQTNPAPLTSQKVWVSSTFVPAGGDITVTVDTSEISNFILFVDVYAESTNSGQIVKGSIVNIDGEGRKFGSLTIPFNAEQGSWAIKRVSIVDSSGNSTDYYDGQDMTAIFTVTSP
jgi:hypothetical protein